MTLQAPAIADARAPRQDSPAKASLWLAGIGVRQVRIATGLVMFAYVFSHFFNHALGNISYAAMEGWLVWHVRWWRIPFVNFTLYAAAAVHFSLGLWALYQRRHFRYTVAEVTQLLLGLSIPLLLVDHFGPARLGGWLFGLPSLNYASPLFYFWGQRPDLIVVQLVLMTVAWTHACIGLYFWLRLKSFFKWAAPFLLAFAVLLPLLAIIGADQGGREVVELADEQAWRQQNMKAFRPRRPVDPSTSCSSIFRSAMPGRSASYSRRAACAHCASGGAGPSRSPIRTGKFACRRA